MVRFNCETIASTDIIMTHELAKVLLGSLWVLIMLAYNVQASQLQLIAASDKQVYERGEPVGVELTLMNTGNTEECVAPLSPYTYDMDINLALFGGKSIPFAGFRFERYGEPEYVCLAPQASTHATLDIFETHGSLLSYQGRVLMLDPGTYELSVSCRTDSSKDIISNTIMFTIALPQPDDSAWSSLVKAEFTPRSREDSRARISAYLDFVHRFPSHPAVASVLGVLMIVDEANSAIYGEQLLQLFPDTPISGLIITRLYAEMPRERFLSLLSDVKVQGIGKRSGRIAARLLDASAKNKLSDEIKRVRW